MTEQEILLVEEAFKKGYQIGSATMYAFLTANDHHYTVRDNVILPFPSAKKWEENIDKLLKADYK